MKKKYESEALEVCHQSAQNLLELGVIDEDEMQEFNEDCLSPAPKKLFNLFSKTNQTKTPVVAISH